MPDFYVVIKGILYFREQSFFDFWIIYAHLKKSRLNNKIQNLFFSEYQGTRDFKLFDWVVFAYFFFKKYLWKILFFFFRRIMNKFRYDNNLLRNVD